MTDGEIRYRKNQEIELKITDLGSAGEGLGRTDAFLWFVKNTVPGDVVRATVMKVKKNYGYARLQSVLEAGADRREPPCPAAGQCGGCSLQLLNYGAQLRFKERQVMNNLRRIGGLSLERVKCPPIIGMEAPFRYRNKAQLPVGRTAEGELVAGFYAGGTHRIVPCRDCLLAPEENGALRDAVLSWMRKNKIEPYDEETGRGFVRHILIRKGFQSGEIMVCLVTNGALPAGAKPSGHPPAGEKRARGAERRRPALEVRQVISALATERESAGKDWGAKTSGERSCKAWARDQAQDHREKIDDKEQNRRPGGEGRSAAPACLRELAEDLMRLPGVATVVQNINMARGNTILGEETRVLAGAGVITDQIGGIRFEISSRSFYQVNPAQTEKLYQTALRYAGLSGDELVWDLYCGIGTISLFLAQKAKCVRGVEIVEQAVKDARNNAIRNGIGNAEFFVGKAEEVLPWEYQRTGEKADVVVVDPPRKGCDENCLRTMLQMEPRRIVYVSCDSATLARDLKYLTAEGNYALTEVQAVDMFPQTMHVETVARISRIK